MAIFLRVMSWHSTRELSASKALTVLYLKDRHEEKMADLRSASAE